MYNTLYGAIKVQLIVIYSLFMRETITRYGRENIGFLWLLGEPLLFTSGIAIAWSVAGAAHGHAIGVVEFAITGYSSVLLWRNCINRATNGLQQNLDLLVHRRISEFDVIVARSLLEIVGATMSFTLLSVFLSMLSILKLPLDLGEVMFGWILLAWTSITLALMLGAVSEMSEMIEKIIHVTTYLLFPLSGAVFMVDWLTPSFAKVVLFIPMVNELEMIREGWYGVDAVKACYDVQYVLDFNIITTLLGLVLIRKIAGKVERK